MSLFKSKKENTNILKNEFSRKVYFDYSKTTYIEVDKKYSTCQTIFENHFYDILGILYNIYRGYDKGFLLNINEFYFIFKSIYSDVTTILLQPHTNFLKYGKEEEFELFFLKLIYKSNSVIKQLPYIYDSDSVTMISLSAANSLNFGNNTSKKPNTVKQNCNNLGGLGNIGKLLKEEDNNEKETLLHIIERNSSKIRKISSFKDSKNTIDTIERKNTISSPYYSDIKNIENKIVEEKEMINHPKKNNFIINIKRKSTLQITKYKQRSFKDKESNQINTPFSQDDVKNLNYSSFHQEKENNKQKMPKLNENNNIIYEESGTQEEILNENEIYFNTTCQHLTPRQLMKINYPKILNNVDVYDILEYSSNIKNFIKRFVFIKNYGIFVFKNTVNINFLKSFLSYYNTSSNKLNNDMSSNFRECRVILFSSVLSYKLRENFYSKKLCLEIKLSDENEKTLIFSLLNNELENLDWNKMNILFSIFLKLRYYNVQKIFDSLEFETKILSREIFYSQIEFVNCVFNNKKILAFKYDSLPLELNSKSKNSSLIVELLFTSAHYIIESTQSREKIKKENVNKTLHYFYKSIDLLQKINEIQEFDFITEIIIELNKLKEYFYSKIPPSQIHSRQNSGNSMQKYTNKYNYFKSELNEEIVRLFSPHVLEKVFLEFFKNFEYLLFLIPKYFYERVLSQFYLGIFKITFKDFFKLDEATSKRSWNVLDLRKKNIYEESGIFMPQYNKLRGNSFNKKKNKKYDELFKEEINEEEFINK